MRLTMLDFRRLCQAWRGSLLAAGLAIGLIYFAASTALAETCITQSQMSATDRDALVAAAQDFSRRVAADDIAGIRALTIAEYAKNFDGIASAVSATSPKLKGSSPVVVSVYILDASGLKPKPDGSMPTAQFFCSLNNSPSDTNFTIPGLPPGKYGLAMVHAQGSAAPWQMSFVLQQVQGRWLLAGFIPKPMTAANQDGLWYWTQARAYAKKGERWNAWFYYQVAEALLVPVDFVNSTNLEKLQTEAKAVRPLELTPMPTADHPLMLKGKDTTYDVVSLGTDDALGGLDLVVHVKAADTSDPVTARQHDIQVMQAIKSAYPELAQAFHGLWVFAEAPGRSPFGIELPIGQIP